MLHLLRNGAYAKVWLASALGSTFSFGSGAFLAPYLIRLFHVTMAQVGGMLALTSALGIGSGAFLGGVLFDAPRDDGLTNAGRLIQALADARLPSRRMALPGPRGAPIKPGEH